MKVQAWITRMSYTGKLWTDDDFKCYKMNDFCGNIEANLAREKAAKEQWTRRRSWDLMETKSLRQGCSGNMQDSSLSALTPLLTKSLRYTHQQCGLRRSAATTTTQLLACCWMGSILKSLSWIMMIASCCMSHQILLSTFKSVWRCIMKGTQRSGA